MTKLPRVPGRDCVDALYTCRIPRRATKRQSYRDAPGGSVRASSCADHKELDLASARQRLTSPSRTLDQLFEQRYTIGIAECGGDVADECPNSPEIDSTGMEHEQTLDV